MKVFNIGLRDPPFPGTPSWFKIANLGDKIIAPLKVCNRRKALSLFVFTDKVERKEKKHSRAWVFFYHVFLVCFLPQT